VRGAGAAQALESLIPVELEALAIDKQIYGVFTNERGGIEDDLIIARWQDDSFFLVVNAARKQQDIAYLRARLPQLEIEVLDRALLALQGPAAEAVMQQMLPAATGLSFMSGCGAQLAGVDCYITRSGYTGEDGFEISVPSAQALALAQQLLAFDSVKAIGLGARDSLRLEAGLCLYGHDINSDTTPVEAALSWSISPSRRADGAKSGGFPGSERILRQMQQGPSRKRVGLQVKGRAPVREAAEIQDMAGNPVGLITSGGFAPSLEAPVAMGYVDAAQAAPGTELNAIVRGKPRQLTVVPMPFVSRRYQR
jgi:aminomethyltransferase